MNIKEDSLELHFVNLCEIRILNATAWFRYDSSLQVDLRIQTINRGLVTCIHVFIGWALLVEEKLQQ